MKHEKYLYYFRFQFPVDWGNENDHEVEKFIFIIADSNEKALHWGNVLAKKFIDNLFAKHKYFKKINVTGFIWADPNYQFNEWERKEIENFPLVIYGETFE